MYNVEDTITAVSSAPLIEGDVAQTIIRLSGTEAFGILGKVAYFEDTQIKRGIKQGRVRITDSLGIDVVVYCFPSPRSYTGEDMVEIHFFAAPQVVRVVYEMFVSHSRLAGPGEFTLRAFLNGRIDLIQAEAVAEIVAGANTFQLSAAKKLLAGKLGKTVHTIRERILDLLSDIEAAMDFSGEDIQFIPKEDALQSIDDIIIQLQALLDGNIRNEEMIDLPAVGLAGLPNAGKSSLLNALLGRDRSIVSQQQATTRDVLTDILKTDSVDCVLFDCAGLMADIPKGSILDELAQIAALEALKNARLVLFCIDADVDDFKIELRIYEFLSGADAVIVLTKCDRYDDDIIKRKSEKIEDLFGWKPILTSSLNNAGISQLCEEISRRIALPSAGKVEIDDRIAINQRHRRIVTEAILSLSQARDQIDTDNDEIASMFLRNSYGELSYLEKEEIDEAVLGRIFSRFCVGK